MKNLKYHFIFLKKFAFSSVNIIIIHVTYNFVEKDLIPKICPYYYWYNIKTYPHGNKKKDIFGNLNEKSQFFYISIYKYF